MSMLTARSSVRTTSNNSAPEEPEEELGEEEEEERLGVVIAFYMFSAFWSLVLTASL
jgi:hypothetical protein